MILLLFLLLELFSFSACEKETPLLPNEVCSLKAKTGPCRALEPRYFYNSEKQACEIFNYGGCGGNKNNFKTEEECIDLCMESVTLVKSAMPSSSTVRYQLPKPDVMEKTTTSAVPNTLQNPKSGAASKTLL